ncbi:phosphotriesterase, partial [Streptomyces sp. SID89]|nr:phosphotriesterase [Streptomyces sp. SID89]
MSRVNTVLGPIPAEELGFVAIHEHIGYGMPGSELDTRWWKTPEQRYE